MCSLALIVSSIAAGNWTAKAEDEATILTAEEIKAKIISESNFAFYKPASASTASDTVGNICDGWMATYWYGESTNGDDWVEINLGAVKKIDSVDIVWGNVASKYEVQVSTDGKTYTTVKEATKDDGVATKDEYGLISDISVDLLFDAVEAQYVRIQCTEGTRRLLIYEMGVFGTEIPEETTAEETTPEETTPKKNTSEETTPKETTGTDVTTTAAPTTAVSAKVKAPAKAGIKKIAAKKRAAKKVKISLKKISGAQGYQVAVYKTKKNASKNKKAIVKKNVKKLK